MIRMESSLQHIRSREWSFTSRRPPVIFLCVALVIVFAPLQVLSHPLGNFSINHFARLEVGREKIRVRYVIPLAEIPTFQELQRLGSGGSPPSRVELDAYLKRVTASYADELFLQADNARVPLVITATNLIRLSGAAGAET